MEDRNDIEHLQIESHRWADKTFGEDRNPIGALNHLAREIPEVIESINKFNEFCKNAPSTFSGGRDGEYRLTDKGLDDYIKIRHEKYLEYVDCLLLLLDAISNEKISVRVILRAAYEKLEINKKRKWGTADEHGVITHIK